MTSDTSVPQYIPFPRFLLDMKLSHTAKLIYSVLLYRANLSKINGWIDEQGRVYITYPVTEIAENLHKGVSVIKEGLSALDRAGLTERKRNFSAPDTIYVKLPTEGLKTDPQTAGKPAISEPENRPTEGLKTDPQTAGKPTHTEPENQPTDSRETGYQTAGKPATNKKNKIKDRVIDRDNTQPAAAVSRTPLDIFREFAQEQAPGNRELLESLQDFDKNRQDIARANKKRRWTESAAKGICKKLVQLTNEAGVKDRTGYMCACLDSSVAVGWLSVYPYEHFTDHNPIIPDPVASRERLHRSLVRKSEPDKPRKITKETNLSDLINCVGIPLPACSTPAAQKEGGKHE
ncbi:replication initiator protein A [Faecalibacterium intestinale]|uniref:Replication initiator protein A n=1 Tax=Faecalibacterium intestinale TaxID=3133155 RepID=A0ABV1BZR3_9FIRM